MKKVICLAIIAVFLAACNLSREQKAEKLIKESLNKTLYKPETYKSIDTKVDSAFAPYDNPALFEELGELNELNSEYARWERNLKSAKSLMSIFSGSYQSSFDKNQYQESKEDYEKANAKMDKIKMKYRKHYDKIISMLHEDSRFIGYMAVHNYRADNNAGNTLVCNTIFFIDKNFEEVIYSIEVEDYNQMQDTIEQFLEQVEE